MSIELLEQIDTNFDSAQLKHSDSPSVPDEVADEKQEPDHDSEKDQSEWDEMSVGETFAR